jgi:hypothetical protein
MRIAGGTWALPLLSPGDASALWRMKVSADEFLVTQRSCCSKASAQVTTLCGQTLSPAVQQAMVELGRIGLVEVNRLSVLP